jgi:hypothetical protein
MWQHPPLTAAARQIEQGIQDLAQIDASWRAAHLGLRQMRRQACPLLVR